MDIKHHLSDSIRSLAMHYWLGIGTKTSKSKALFCYKIASRIEMKQGLTFSLDHLGLAYEHEYGSTCEPSLLLKAFYVYKIGADIELKNEISSMAFTLARCYELYGDQKKAFHYFRAAAEIEMKKEDFVKISSLARCYEEGIGTEKSPEKALHYRKIAADMYIQKNASTMACFPEEILNLARCFENGIGEKSPKKAFYYYKIAAEIVIKANNLYWGVKPILELARCYEDGVGTEKSPEQAFYYYKIGAEMDMK